MAMAKQYEIAFKLGAEQTSSFKSAFSGAGATIKKLGPIAAAAGAAIAAGFGTAITAAAKFSNEVDKTFGKLEAQTGLMGKDLEKLQGVVKNVYGTGFSESMDEASNAVAQVYQIMGDIPAKELENITNKAFAMAQAYDADINETTRAASQLMQQFGIDSTDAMDMMTVAFQRGGNYSSELLDSISEYSTQFANMGFTAEQMMGMFTDAAASGIFSLDKMSDAVKESFLQITDGADGTKAAIAELGLDYNQVTSDIQMGGDRANAAFGVIMSAIAGVENAADRNRLAIELMGTPIEDLGPQYQSFFANIGKGMEGFEGAAERAAKAMSDNFGFKMNAIWNQLQIGAYEAFEAMGGGKALDAIASGAEKLLPVILDLTNKVVGFAQNLMKYWPLIQAKAVEIFNNIAAYVRPAVEAVVSFVGDQVAKIRKFWETDGAQIAEAARNAFTMIKAIIQFVMPAVELIIKTVWENIKGVITGALDIIMGVVRVFSGLLTGDFSKMWEGIKQLFSGAITFVWNLVNLMFIGKLLGGIKSFGTSLISSLKGTWDNVIGGIKNLVTSAKTWFDEMVTGIKTKFDDIVTAAKELPGKIGQGIKDKISDATGAIKELAEKLITKFKEALGIASPSKVFYDMAGWIVKGLTNGLDAENLKNLGKKVFSGFVGGALNTLDAIKGFITGDGGAVNYTPTAGVEQWRSLAAQALQMTGQYSEANLNRLLMQMKSESGGNPRAINLWDSNAKKGIPSKGLMQTIDPTFKAYAMPGYNSNVYDPLSNILASIRYSLARYGSLEKAWKGSGYATGGVVSRPELAMVGEGRDTESIIPWNNSARSFALWAMTGRKIGAFNRGQSPLAVKRRGAQTGGQLNVNPSFTYHIIVQGNASQGDLEAAMRQNNASMEARFKSTLESVLRNEERLSF